MRAVLAVIIIFLALAFGLMAFASLQDSLPDELSFLKDKSVKTAQPAVDPRSVISTQHLGWTVLHQGGSIEISRHFSGELKVNGRSYDVPSVGILCHAGGLDARIDTRMPTKGERHTSLKVNGLEQVWEKGQRTNIFPPSPRTFIQNLVMNTQSSFIFDFTEQGSQMLTLSTDTLKTVLATLPPHCNPGV